MSFLAQTTPPLDFGWDTFLTNENGPDELPAQAASPDASELFKQQRYGLVFIFCYLPAKVGYRFRPGPQECTQESCAFRHVVYSLRLASRSTKAVRAGAAKKYVDDKLEYGLRLSTGVGGLPRDAAKAMSIFKEVMTGKFPEDKRGLAASLAAFLAYFRNEKKYYATDATAAAADVIEAVELCHTSCQHGHYAFISVAVVVLLIVQLDIVLTGEMLNRPKISYLFSLYYGFQAKTGFQPWNSRYCATCGTRRRSFELQKCSGRCGLSSKPVYCDRHCQKADWKNHRKWCVLPTATEDELVEDLALYSIIHLREPQL
ncbi:hypothetical protein NLJ89_g3932 [Agrocybe chaxingu]|uniref:MYND-type domain-containing protein n=1 Tax=Agrocybe chaxingu TaxID=84603 RepID=A0A9W8MWZ2_9AGAR|nr:hypothetical protein NLJ89_g3932 [Agrocybe chaxingu]